MANQTKLEREWDNEAIRIFRSERHGLMVIADTFPKLPFSCVIATRTGTPDVRADFELLPSLVQHWMYEVAGEVGRKILPLCDYDQRVYTRIEGHGIPDHPHIVVAAAKRNEGAKVFTDQFLGAEVIQQTLEAVQFSDEEAERLMIRLDEIY